MTTGRQQRPSLSKSVRRGLLALGDFVNDQPIVDIIDHQKGRAPPRLGRRDHEGLMMDQEPSRLTGPVRPLPPDHPWSSARADVDKGIVCPKCGGAYESLLHRLCREAEEYGKEPLE